MDTLLPTLELVCISFGAGAAFIFDCFFMLSLKDHKIKKHEERILRRISLVSITAAFLAIILYITNISTRLELVTDTKISFAGAKLIMLGVAFIAGLTLRRIHLPTLLRYQRNYFHLSDAMIQHQNSLVATAAYSTVSWLAVIFLTSIESRNAVNYFNYNFISIFITYLVVAFITSQIAVFLKNKILTR